MKLTRQMRVRSVEAMHHPGFVQVEAGNFDETVTFRMDTSSQPRVGDKLTVHIVQEPEDALDA